MPAEEEEAEAGDDDDGVVRRVAVVVVAPEPLADEIDTAVAVVVDTDEKFALAANTTDEKCSNEDYYLE